MSINLENDKLMYPEAAALLRISESDLRRKVMLRMVPHMKPFGKKGRVIFLRSDLEKFLESSRVEVDGSRGALVPEGKLAMHIMDEAKAAGMKTECEGVVHVIGG